MKMLIYSFCFLFLLNCTKAPEVEQQPAAPKTKEASAENCFRYSKGHQTICKQLKNNNDLCVKTSNKDDCKKALDSFYSLYKVETGMFYDSKEACWNIGNENPIEICEKGDPQSYSGLTEQTLQWLISRKEPEFKILQLSEKIAHIRNKTFDKNRLSKMRAIKPQNPPKMYAVEEIRGEKSKKFFEYWVYGQGFDCVSDSLRAKLLKLQKKASPGTREINISHLNKELFNNCQLTGLVAYTKEGLKKVPSKAFSLQYTFARHPRSECNFPVPRIAVRYQSKLQPYFLLSSGVTEIKNPQMKQLITSMNKAPQFFGLKVMKFLETSFTYKNKKYIASPLPGMSDCSALYEMSEFGPFSRAGTCNQPCGS